MGGVPEWQRTSHLHGSWEKLLMNLLLLIAINGSGVDLNISRDSALRFWQEGDLQGKQSMIKSFPCEGGFHWNKTLVAVMRNRASCLLGMGLLIGGFARRCQQSPWLMQRPNCLTNNCVGSSEGFTSKRQQIVYTCKSSDWRSMSKRTAELV